MSVTSRVRLLTVVLVLATALAIGAISLSGYRALIFEQQQNAIAQGVHGDVQRLKLSLEEAINDARMLAMLPSAVATAEASGGGREPTLPAERLAAVMREALRVKRYYSQIRLIGPDDRGLELVRVERVGSELRRVPESQLQAKGDRYYVQEALRREPGAVYVSPVDLNREQGVITTPHRAMLRVAVRVESLDKSSPLGVVVINVDYQELIGTRLDLKRSAGAVMITNETGDYLTHPDPSQAFGFDLGARRRLQDDHPELATFFESDEQEATVEVGKSGLLRVEKTHVFPYSSDRYLAFALLASRADLSAGAEAISRRATLATVVIMVGAVVVALPAIRAQTSSIRHLTEAVGRLARGEPLPPVPDSQRDELGVLTRSFHDMATSIRRKESEALAANERLRSANQDLEHFVHMAAHDLREPLRKQRNLVDLLKGNGHDDELLDAIGTCSSRMQAMVDDFRELSRIGGVTTQPSPIDLKRIIDACVDEHAVELNERQVCVDIAETLPVGLVGCAGLVSRLYDNLVRNALHHAQDKGFQLGFTSSHGAKGWVLGVRNTGSSVPESMRGEVFRMFRKASGSRGSGVGLSICRKVVESHEGSIWIESTDDSVHVQFTLGDSHHDDQIG